MSFNGGKDITVAFHIIRAVCEELEGNTSNKLFKKFKFVHFVKEGEFAEIERFRNVVEQMYGIKVELFSSDFKGEMKKLVEQEGIEAVVLGNRRQDPFSELLDHFTPSSEGWPAFTRVMPILDWTYSDVWKFLLSNSLCYCALYDEGYTSLGEMHNTVKNPYLKREGNGITELSSHLPAYMLQNDDYERCSRIDSK